MKVKEFIDLIRPITLRDPESELILSYSKDDLDIQNVIFYSDVVFISLITHLPSDHE